MQKAGHIKGPSNINSITFSSTSNTTTSSSSSTETSSSSTSSDQEIVEKPIMIRKVSSASTSIRKSNRQQDRQVNSNATKQIFNRSVSEKAQVEQGYFRKSIVEGKELRYQPGGKLLEDGFVNIRADESKKIINGIFFLQKFLLEYSKFFPCNAIDNKNIYLDLGRAFIKLGGQKNLQNGLKYLEKTLKYTQYSNDKAKLLNEIGRTYILLGRKNNILKGLEYLNNSLKLYQNDSNLKSKPDNEYNIAKLLNDIGIAHGCLRGEDNILLEIEFLEKSCKIFEKNQKPELGFGIAYLQIHDNLGMAYRKLGGEVNLALSFRCFESTLIFYRRMYSLIDNCFLAGLLGQSLYQLGTFYRQLSGEDNVRKGLIYQCEALEIREKLCLKKYNLETNLFEKILTIDILIEGENDIRDGFNFLKKILAKYEGYKPYQDLLGYDCTILNYEKIAHEIANLFKDIGDTYISLGSQQDIQEGLTYLVKAIPLHEDYDGLCDYTGRSYINLGGKENIEEGLKYLEEGLRQRKETVRYDIEYINEHEVYHPCYSADEIKKRNKNIIIYNEKVAESLDHISEAHIKLANLYQNQSQKVLSELPYQCVII